MISLFAKKWQYLTPYNSWYMYLYIYQIFLILLHPGYMTLNCEPNESPENEDPHVQYKYLKHFNTDENGTWRFSR